LAEVLQILATNNTFIKRSKYSSAQPQLEYLGHIIGAHGVASDPTKIKAVQQWPTPSNVKQVKSFLGGWLDIIGSSSNNMELLVGPYLTY
jgi:hypothetical protein